MGDGGYMGYGGSAGDGMGLYQSEGGSQGWIIGVSGCVGGVGLDSSDRFGHNISPRNIDLLCMLAKANCTRIQVGELSQTFFCVWVNGGRAGLYIRVRNHPPPPDTMINHGAP